MAKPQSDLPHDFPVRVLRDALVEPHNLRDLLARVVPQLVGRLDFSHIEVVKRSYLLDDWRRREADVLIRLKFRDTPQSQDLLVCILVEHQSTTDPAMPLRLLLYAVLFWEQQWKEWEEGHERGKPLRLTPVLPVVLHTGTEPWDTNRRFADLFDAPPSLAAYIPQWQTSLCDLVELPTEDLLKGEEALWNALAVVRAERADATQFLDVLRQALQRLEPLAQQELVRWHQLLKLVLYWAVYRRSRREQVQIKDIVRASHNDALLQKEADKMAQQTWETYEQELAAMFEERGRKAGELLTLRTALRTWLSERFQTVPPGLLEQIDRADLEHLQAALKQVVHIKAPEELLL